MFPSMFTPLSESILGKAAEKRLLQMNITDIRSFAKDKHHTADDTPYGGGPGMVMKPELIFEAVKKARGEMRDAKHEKIIMLSPAGRTLNNDIAKDLAKCDHLILICGHYEGVDQRVIDELVDEEISIGDYVLTGGELPAMVLIDVVARFIPGVLGDEASSKEDSFSHVLLEHPQYTKPADCAGSKVPDILMSGDHKNIAKWRREASIKNTFFGRPDLLAKARLTAEDSRSLENIFTGGR